MDMYRRIFGAITVLATAILLSGCNPNDQPSPTGTDAQSHAGHDHEDGHEDADGHEGGEDADKPGHADEGPHGGHLIELGRNHEYHAELVEDDATEAITVYILDSNQKEQFISSPTVSLSLTADGNTLTQDLTGVSDDPTNGFSRFETAEKAIYELLEHGSDVTGKLRVTINDVPYVGTIDHHDHSPDHSTHDHE